MRYAGFWVRTAAGFIDFLIFLPLMLLFFWAESHSRNATLLMVIPYYLSYASFCIYFLARFGKTPGKMMMKLEVMRIDGTKIELKEALLRHSVDAIFGLIAGIGMMIAVLHTDYTLFRTEMAWIERNNMIMENSPTFATAFETLSIVWTYSELIILIFNRKKRAIHDFLAGTVVVHASRL